MKKISALTLAALFLAQNPVFVYAAETVMVESVRVSAESVYITTDKPVKYKVFQVSQPPKVVVELENAKLKTLEEIPVNSTFIARVRTGQYKTSPVSVARIVLELTRKSVYDITQKGNELVVVLGGKFDNKKPAAAPVSVIAPDAKAPAAPVSVIAPDAKAPAAVKAPSEAASAGEARVIAPSSAAPAPAAPAAVKPSAPRRESAQTIAPGKPAAYADSGFRDIMANLPTELITLDYPEVEIRDLIGMLAAKAGINVIYTTDVSGNTSINLSKVPFEEAFKIILNVNGLAAQQVGDNILRIASPQTFLAEQKKAYQQTRVFFLSYAQAAAAKGQIDAVGTAEGRTASCAIDSANNALIVTDSAAGLESIGRLIRSLDRVPRQVLIEAKFVEVALDSEAHLGVQWYAEAGTRAGSVVNRKAENAIPFAEAVYGAFRIGKVMGNSMIEGVILAAAQKGKVKVLSDPKITTLNNKEASIDITKETPYTVEEWSATVPPVRTIKSEYKKTGISLKVTPSINPDGRILMKVTPSVSQASANKTIIGGAPGIDTRMADTNVIVRNGETIVIGGLIQDTQSEVVFKIPLLGDIPLLGWLFRKKSVVRSRMELLIFVTPRVMED